MKNTTKAILISSLVLNVILATFLMRSVPEKQVPQASSVPITDDNLSISAPANSGLLAFIKAAYFPEWDQSPPGWERQNSKRVTLSFDSLLFATLVNSDFLRLIKSAGFRNSSRDERTDLVRMWLETAFAPVTADLEEQDREKLSQSLVVNGENLIDELEFAKRDSNRSKSH
jgi:uncharacterized membrane protein